METLYHHMISIKGKTLYYIHQAKNLDMLLITEPLSNANFNTWKRSMIMALYMKNKLGFIDGSVAKSDSTISFMEEVK